MQDWFPQFSFTSMQPSLIDVMQQLENTISNRVKNVVCCCIEREKYKYINKYILVITTVYISYIVNTDI